VTLTLTSDDLESDIIVNDSSTVTNTTNWFVAALSLIVDVRTYGDDLKNRLQWYGHVLRKEDNDCVKKYMEYEVEAARPRGRPKKLGDCGKRLSGM